MTGILQALLASVKAAVSAVTDEYFEYVSLLLPGNGTNGAQNNTFLDSSTNNFSITRNGNTTQGTFSPFSQTGWGNYFDGSGDYLSNTSAALITQNVSTFTIEGWIYMTANPTSDVNNISGFITVDGQPAGTFNYMAFGPISSRVLYLRWFDGSAKTANGGTTLNLNQWYHIACVVNSNAIQFYVNGVAETMSGTTTLTNRNGTSGNFSVGSHYYGAIAGYLSNVRVTTTAVYTAAFTPPTSPLTAITNTKLLTCQSNRFIDNSSNAYALTVGGTPSVQAFSPFAPTAAYSTSVVGGSGYFDGTGDYLTAASNAFRFGTGNFTIEFWYYPTVFGTNTPIDMGYTNSGSYVVQSASDGKPYFYIGGPGTIFTSATAYFLNAWNHLAVVRSGSTLSMFLNGSRVGTATNSTDINANFSLGIGGSPTHSSPFVIQGFLSNVRLVKGTAVYDPSLTTLTVPTAPLTNITNTSLLLDMTNAGIIDNAMMNDLETVGNAQISTTQSKFGGSSMYFDGTGDYLTAPSSTNLSLGTGDFTIEGWAYNAGDTHAGLFQISTTAGGLSTSLTNTLAVGMRKAPVEWQVYAKGGATDSSSQSWAANTWYHFALVRSSGTTKLYINGTGIITVSSDTTDYTCSNIVVGGYYSTAYLLNGYIDDLRITKGYARYTANFTPPASAFPLQ
jgi:hypothetical protein